MRYDCSFVRSEKLFFRFLALFVGLVLFSFFCLDATTSFSFFIFSHPFHMLLLFLLTVFRCSRSHPHVEEFCEHAHEEVKSRGKQGGGGSTTVSHCRITAEISFYHASSRRWGHVSYWNDCGWRLAPSFFCERRLCYIVPPSCVWKATLSCTRVGGGARCNMYRKHYCRWAPGVSGRAV